MSRLIDTSHENVGAECGDSGNDDKPNACAVLVHVLDLFFLFPFGFEKCRVGA